MSRLRTHLNVVCVSVLTCSALAPARAADKVTLSHELILQELKENRNEELFKPTFGTRRLAG